MAPASDIVLTVGPGKDYATIEAAVQAAPAGATIDVQAGTYTNDFLSITQDLTLQAQGGFVRMVETEAPPNGKAMIVEGTPGTSVTINGFDISGVQVSAGNGAAIRYQGGTLTLNDDYFHNNQDGLLAATDTSGTIDINASEFAFNGIGDGRTHNIYVNDIAELQITNSYFHDANVGHEIKSRAEDTVITGTRVFDNNSTASYSIDLPNGGNATIENDTIEKGPNSENPNIIRYGEEGSLHGGTSVLIADNTIVNDRSSAVVVGNATTTPLVFRNNTLYGLTSKDIGGPVDESGTLYLTTRPELSTVAPEVACFAAGTHIQTARGAMPVEDLTPGDAIVTQSGEALPLQWLGHRRIDLTRHRQPELVAPVRILRNAFAHDLPRRDLLISPDHCLFVDGRLIPAKLLINHMTIVQERAAAAVEYYHVELVRHAVVLAEGVPAESYLDTGNRALFANAGLALLLHPECTVNAGLKQWATDACAPLTVDPAAVRPVWTRLAERAEALGFARPCCTATEDAALRLAIGERSIAPVAHAAGRYVFALPADVDAVRLVSRATVASRLRPWVDDRRRLGVAVGGIVLRCGGARWEIAPDDPALQRGWHAAESDGSTCWRWTDGDAVLPLPDHDEAAILEITVAIAMTYRAEDAPPDPVRLVA